MVGMNETSCVWIINTCFEDLYIQILSLPQNTPQDKPIKRKMVFHARVN